MQRKGHESGEHGHGARSLAVVGRLEIREIEAYRCQCAIRIIHKENAQLGSMLQRTMVSTFALGLVQVSLALAYLRHIATF